EGAGTTTEAPPPTAAPPTTAPPAEPDATVPSPEPAPTRPATEAPGSPSASGEDPATQLRVDREPLATVRRAGPGGVVTAQPVARFEVFGVSDDAFPAGSATLDVRFHDADGWSEWFELHRSPDHAPDRGTAEAAAGRVASEPIWVGEADGYQLRAPGSARLAG